MEVLVVERRKQVEVEEAEARWRERALVAEVRLPAQAEAYRCSALGAVEGRGRRDWRGGRGDD